MNVSADYYSKAIDLNQFDPGYDDPAIDQPPTCDGCDAADVRLTDYFGGMLKQPLMLCEDCCIRKAELAHERDNALVHGGCR